MSKCSTCRKSDALDTKWERLCRFFCEHLFANIIQDISSEKFTQGFSDGYMMVLKHSMNSDNEIKIEELIKKNMENQLKKISVEDLYKKLNEFIFGFFGKKVIETSIRDKIFSVNNTYNYQIKFEDGKEYEIRFVDLDNFLENFELLKKNYEKNI